MGQFHTYYTLQEANDLLPEIRRVLAEMSAIREELAGSWQRAAPVIKVAGSNGGGSEANDYVTNLSRFTGRLRWFADRGIQLKDIDRGLIDFPALREGEEVLLCWEQSESRVGFWHDLESGYPGRQPW